MTEWLYKATPTRIPLEPTQQLAIKDGFICRSAFGKRARAANTRAVRFGDVIHFYFVEDGNATTIGTFEVIDAKEHPNRRWFGSRVDQTCLFEVQDPSFEQTLKLLPRGRSGSGYGADRRLGTMVGWAIRRAARTVTPPYDPSSFPPRNTLVRG